MRSIKSIALGTVFAAATTVSAMAAPITGAFDITGQFIAENNSGQTSPLVSATAIDFCANTIGTCVGTAGSAATSNGTGAFTANNIEAGSSFTFAPGTQGLVKDFSFAPFAGLIDNFYTIGSLSFDLLTVTVTPFTNAGIQFLNLAGTGLMQMAGFDDTAATFSFTGQNSGTSNSGQFTFSGAAAATPAPVPEPASLALFGAGLLGLGMARRLRKSA